MLAALHRKRQCSHFPVLTIFCKMKRIAFLVLLTILVFSACKKEEEVHSSPIIVLKTGEYTANGEEIPVGGRLSFGIVASSANAAITNLRIQRIVNGVSITELDKGLYITEGGLDFVFNAVKSAAENELWRFMVMNANRDTAVTTLTVLLGEGSAYGPIHHFQSLRVGMQHNTQYPQFLDLHSGNLFTSNTVAGNEALVDFVGFVYLTSGVMSPTLCCPAYTGSSSVTTHYPQIANWPVRRATLYDYFSSDNDLVNSAKFEAAQNDSLLVASYKPQNVSGLSKYAYTGKIIPFKTEDGKYGLIRVHHSDITTDGYMELEIKIQQ